MPTTTAWKQPWVGCLQFGTMRAVFSTGGRLILCHSNSDVASSKTSSKVPLACPARTEMTCPNESRSVWGVLAMDGQPMVEPSMSKNNGTYVQYHSTSLRPRSSSSWSILSSSGATPFLLPWTSATDLPPCSVLVSVPCSSSSCACPCSPGPATSSFSPSSGFSFPYGSGECQLRHWPMNLPLQGLPGKFGRLLRCQPQRPARWLQGLLAEFLQGRSESESPSWNLLRCQFEWPTVSQIFPESKWWGSSTVAQAAEVLVAKVALVASH